MLKIDQFSTANEAVIAQFNQFAKLSLANFEKFAEISLGVARDSVAQATQHAQSLAAARDVQEVIAINSAAVEPAMKRAYAVSRTAYETAAQANEQVKRAFEKQAGEMNKAAVAALEEAYKYAPAGTEGMVGNMKTAIAAAQNAYGNAVAINKQFYDTVEKTVEQNVATVKSSVKKAATKSKRK